MMDAFEDELTQAKVDWQVPRDAFLLRPTDAFLLRR
jgi:hypothetical protein